MRVTLAFAAVALLAVCMTPPASATIYGSLTIRQIQDPATAPNPVGLPNPTGSAAGDTVGPVFGIITDFDTFPSGYGFYMQDVSAGYPWSGIDVFTGGNNTYSTLGLRVGDRVSVTGALAEFSTFLVPCAGAGVDGLTEIIAKNGNFGTDLTITKLSSGNPLPAYHLDTVAGLSEPCTNSNAEQWEGCLVKVNAPMRICRTNASGGLGTFRAALVVDNSACPPGHVGACDSMFIDLSTMTNPALEPGTIGQGVVCATGIYGSSSRGYRIQARNASDYGLLEAPPLGLDFNASSTIQPNTSRTMTAQAPASVELVQGADTQIVQLQSATFQVTFAPLTGAYYEPMTITAASGSFGPCTVNGVSIPSSTFTLIGPAYGGINYARGILVAEMIVLVQSPGLPSIRVLTYTTGTTTSPTTIRLFMDGSSVQLPALASSVPTLSAPGVSLLGLGLVGAATFTLWVRRRRSQA